MRLRSDCLAPSMVGKRYGTLTVLKVCRNRRRSPCGQSRVMVRARCDCGRTETLDSFHVRRGATVRCSRCRREHVASFQRDEMSVRLPSGKTLAQLAIETGIKLNTLFVRWSRGWHESELALPTQRRRSRR